MKTTFDLAYSAKTNTRFGSAEDLIWELEQISRQDTLEGKPTPVVSDLRLLPDIIAAALEGRQLQPLLLGPEAR